MGRSLILVLSAALLCSGECIVVSGPPKFGRVEVSAFSASGERLPTIDVDLIAAITNRSFKPQIKGAAAAKIPYGLYTVRVSAPGFRRSERQLFVNQPEVFVRMQLSVAIECGDLAEAHGMIHSIPNDHELWVKLVPLRGAGGVETRVARDGSFVAGRVEDGQYLLFVIDGNAIVHATSVMLPASSPLDIDLGKK
jgi:hypothetical protein